MSEGHKVHYCPPMAGRVGRILCNTNGSVLSTWEQANVTCHTCIGLMAKIYNDGQAKVHRSLLFTEDTPLCNQNRRLPMELVTADNNAVTCGSCKRSMKTSWGIDIDAPKPRKKNTMATKKNKATRPKRKMTVAQRKKIWDQITPGTTVDIWFAKIEDFNIDMFGDLTTESGDLPRQFLAQIAKGEAVRCIASGEWSEYEQTFDLPCGDEHELFHHEAVIHAASIVALGTTKRLRLDSIDETMVLDANNKKAIKIGCRTLNKADADKAAHAIFEWLGYEVIE